MASALVRQLILCGVRGGQNRVLGVASGISNQQVATITSPAAYRPTKEKPAPWPYNNKTFTVLDQFTDSTEARLDENSKVIVVEGNLAVGKSAFARKLADNLQFHFVPAITEHDIFFNDFMNVDQRFLNNALPDNAKFYDLKAWLRDQDPSAGRGAKIQLAMYKAKLKAYSKGLHHLLNTGQGVIVERSVFTDQAFAEAMYACGYMSRKALAYYREVKRQTIFDMWKPHLTIYLDAPVSFAMQQIKKRNYVEEKNSPVLNEKFLTEIDNSYKRHILPDMKHTGEVLIYDASDMDDLEVIVEDIERLNLNHDQDHEKRFQQWEDNKLEDFLSYYRRYFGSERHIENLFNLPLPWHVPEMMDSPEVCMKRTCTAAGLDRLQYAAGYNPKLDDKLNILLR